MELAVNFGFHLKFLEFICVCCRCHCTWLLGNPGRSYYVTVVSLTFTES